MLTVLIDYGAGNLHSAEKAFQRMAREVDAGEVLVSDRAEDVARADRVVLPGVGVKVGGTGVSVGVVPPLEVPIVGELVVVLCQGPPSGKRYQETS